ncbi:HK97 gp10 family phage protein [Halomonas sp. HP20-15]|uniref:HK97-gp10 family putative phage morphogenesis protein n=1 Tax=Halomonas sp. HP20-15 TaxID=3085901 RepID=UPI002981158D|nr:HK97-gp10 family putative phage morphogenesis protein [Halomonas sp. HP20-15]MDW5376838.1 HK97 gp10 family phage protein [Halomonas sp. HP20-15]
MADAVRFEVHGLVALGDRLEGLQYDMKRKGGRFALRKAANVIRDKAKANAKRIDDPTSAADISENMAVRWSGRHFKQTGDLKFRVGIMGGAGGRANSEALAGLPGGDTRHWRHVEFGTEHTRAQPFMRPALAESIQAASEEFVRQYHKSLDRALKRAAKASQ